MKVVKKQDRIGVMPHVNGIESSVMSVLLVVVLKSLLAGWFVLLGMSQSWPDSW
jgi:hypothetical protein